MSRLDHAAVVCPIVPRPNWGRSGKAYWRRKKDKNRLWDGGGGGGYGRGEGGGDLWHCLRLSVGAALSSSYLATDARPQNQGRRRR